MKYQLEYNISIHFTLTDAEFEILTDAIKNNDEVRHHAELGGFWYGNINRRNFSKDKAECMHEVTTRQMDTVILKALEYYKFHGQKSPFYQIGKSLFIMFFKSLEHAILTAGHLNRESKVIEL